MIGGYLESNEIIVMLAIFSVSFLVGITARKTIPIIITMLIFLTMMTSMYYIREAQGSDEVILMLTLMYNDTIFFISSIKYESINVVYASTVSLGIVLGALMSC